MIALIADFWFIEVYEPFRLQAVKFSDKNTVGAIVF